VDDLLPEKYRTDFEIVRETAEQVIKDVQLSGFDLRFSGDPLSAYSELRQQLLPILQDLHKSDSSAFQALLYRIDLSESEFARLPRGADFYGQLTDKVLQREFKKVLIRRYFRDRGANPA
jgi:hypothetical protein